MTKSTVKKRKGTKLMTIGLLLMAAALFLALYNIWDGMRAERAARDIVDELEPIILKDGDPLPDNLYDDLDPDKEMETITINGYEYIGYLEIPSLELKLPVMAEWDYNRLRISPCRYSGSYYKNDLVIAAHNYIRHFSSIRWIKPSSDVYFINVKGRVFHYQVDYVETLRETQVEDMVSGDWDLTLFTCNSGGWTRCAVRCMRVE